MIFNSPKIRIFHLEQDHNSARFISALSSSIETTTVSQLEQWLTNLTTHHGSVGVLELAHSMPDSEIQRRINITSRLSQNNLCQSIAIAVTDAEMSQFSKELLIYGFARVFCSQLEAADLAKVIAKHRKNVSWPAIPFKKRVAANLPWS